MDLRGRKVLVVGLARTGSAVVRFLRAKGSIVTVTEAKPREAMKETAQEMERMGVPVEWGRHATGTFLNQDLLVISPLTAGHRRTAGSSS